MIAQRRITFSAGFAARVLKVAGLCCAAALILVMASAAGAGQSAWPQDRMACVKCHASEGLSDGGGRDLGPHRQLDCADCHQGAKTYPHENLSLTACRSCHNPHNEEVTGDLHVGVKCSACHLAGAVEPDAPHSLMDVKAESSCQRCHHTDNKVGASAMVLPPKSALCLACHTATLSLTDWSSRVALGLLALGMLGSLGFWLSGGNQGPAPGHGHLCASGPGSILRAVLLDGLLQRRLWRISPFRWLTHGLIFLPFLARTAWALTALALGRWNVSADFTQAMLNKNDAVTALFFDLTGVMVLAGVALAFLRRALSKKKTIPGLPRPDWLAMGLLAGIVLSGFITEAARMAMTGAGAATPYAFLGVALSGLFSAGPGLQEAYGYIWYAHAICYAAFVAYLPFSRMRHILLTPLWLALASGSGRDKDLD